MTELNIDKLRVDAAKRGKWNIGFFSAGFLFWVYVGFIGNHFPLATARIYWIVGTFFIFPLAVLISKIFKADPFTKGNTLGELVGYTHMSIITLTFPIIIVTAVYFPEALILIMAICYCLDFFVMTWVFGSWLFSIHGAFRTFVVTIIFFAVPEWRLTVLPAIVAILYLATVILIPILRKRWLEKHAKIITY
jgi:hypothetical protein